MRTLMYKATNAVTGEAYEGTGRELAVLLNVAPQTINKASLQRNKVTGLWIIEKSNRKLVSPSEYSFTQALADEWDEVTKPFKTASRKKQFNTPGRVSRKR